MYRRSLEGWMKHWDFILLDTLCLQIAYLLAYAYRFGYNRFVYRHEDYRDVGLLLVLFSCFIAVFFNTMHSVVRRGVMEEIRMTLVQCLLVFSAVALFLFTTKDSETVSRIVLYITMGVYFVVGFVIRVFYKEFLIKNKLARKTREMLLVSDKDSAESTINRINSHPEDSINIKGLILVDGDPDTEGTTVAGIPVVAAMEGAADYILNEWIEEVYIAVSRYDNISEQLIHNCEEMAVTVHQCLFPKIDTQGRQLTQRIAKEPVLTYTVRIVKPWQMFVKRLIDIVAGFFMSILALLVLVFVTPFFTKESPGPVLLRHERIGRNGKKFTMYTIRIMYLDAEKRLNDWKEKHGDEKLTVANDPRIIGNRETEDGYKTGIGAFIRRWSLQVLPKGFNILSGQMSLVGTRAPSVKEWEEYEFHHRARLACKPGIIGLWHTSSRSSEMNFEEATKLDTEYITNWSLGLDFRIMLKALAVR